MKKKNLIQEINTDSNIIKTAKGCIEWSASGMGGPHLVGIHGGPGGYDQIHAVYPDMYNKGFRILAWSRPGYLRTPLTVGETFREQADALAMLMDALEIETAAILAFSAGGPVALEFALHHPDRIWALILESAVSRRYAINPHNLELQLQFSKLMFNNPVIWITNLLAKHKSSYVFKSLIKTESSLSQKEVEALLLNIMDNPKKIEIIKGLVKSMSPASLRKAGLDNDLKQLEHPIDLPLDRITTPTLIIHGTHDFDVSFYHAWYAAKSIPKAELFPVEEGFHIIPLCDQDEAVTAKRLAFLRTFAP
jgi:pimeloyl-ACP methyl ester carboxylesterase